MMYIHVSFEIQNMLSSFFFKLKYILSVHLCTSYTNRKHESGIKKSYVISVEFNPMSKQGNNIDVQLRVFM